jgi:hypothetical protein
VLFALLRGGLGAVQLIRGGLDSPKNWGEILGFQSPKNRKVIVLELEEALPCCPFGMGQCFFFSISVGPILPGAAGVDFTLHPMESVLECFTYCTGVLWNVLHSH